MPTTGWVSSSLGQQAWRPRRRRPSKWARLRGFVSENNEFWGIPIGVFLYFVSEGFFRYVSPEAGTFDFGLLHGVFFALATFVTLKALVWLFLALDFPKVYKYLDKQLNADFDQQSGAFGPKQRAHVAVVLYLAYFAGFIALVCAVV